MHPSARVLLCLPLLAGCALGKDQFPAVCPHAALLPQAADLTRYRGGPGPHDLTDLIMEARVVKLDGKCEPGPNPHTLDATVTVTIEVTRGPAAMGRTVEVPYFVAAAEGESILDKHVYTNRVTFPPNVDRLMLVGDPVHMRFPISPEQSGAAYTVWVGVQRDAVPAAGAG